MAKFKAIKYTTGKATGQGFAAALLGGIVFAALLGGCNSSPTAPDNSPIVSNLVVLGGKLYDVAYKSPDLTHLNKVDTIKISFSYNSSKVKSIAVRATIDSQKTWLAVADVSPTGSGKADLAWIPKNDPAAFAYFGKKEAYVRVLDTISGEHIDSDSFSIYGSVPYVLSSPKRKESFAATDTISIAYMQNQDLSSNISVGFIIPSDTGYVNISDRSEAVLISRSLPIKNFVMKFVPQDFADKAGNFSAPITIFIADYGGPSTILQADSITITR
jgi:hypothetical protein